MDDTVSAIVEVSALPISILIVGVGKKSFQQFVIMDGDQRRLKDKNGKPAIRDIVQFIDYNKTQSLTGLSEQLLEELPDQIVKYFKMKKVNPMGVV